MPKVAVIVLTYNSVSKLGDFFEQVLVSLANQTFHDYELIFVDNASKDHTVEYLRASRKNIKRKCTIIGLPSNLGYCGGNNRGAVITRNVDYLFFVNDDVILDNNALKMLIDFMENNEEVGALQPVIVNADGSSKSTLSKA